MTAASRLVPATGLPLLYFAFAHFCLGLGFAALVVSPGLPAGFFHHPRMVALVHLVTLGWITSSILGAFYIVGPLALLAGGLAFTFSPLVRVGSAFLLAGVILNAAQATVIATARHIVGEADIS